MAEKTILVCDVCGQPATHTATILIGGRRLLKDYCDAQASGRVIGRRSPPVRTPDPALIPDPSLPCSAHGGGDRVLRERTCCEWPQSKEQQFPKPCVAGSIRAEGTDVMSRDIVY